MESERQYRNLTDIITIQYVPPDSFRYVIDCTQEEFDGESQRVLKVARKYIGTVGGLIFFKIKDTDGGGSL